MHTLFDFITHIKAVEYILSIMFIAGFILYWEILKPKPFRTLSNTAREDLVYVKGSGRQHMIGKVVMALLLTLRYMVSVPFAFAYAVFSAARNSRTHDRPGTGGQKEV